jgi:hypothetical protein
VEARVQLRLVQDSEIDEKVARLLGCQLLERLRGSAKVEELSLFRLFHPIGGVVVSFEADRRTLLERAPDDFQDGIVDRLCLLESVAELLREFAEGFRHGCIEQHDGEGNRS